MRLDCCRLPYRKLVFIRRRREPPLINSPAVNMASSVMKRLSGPITDKYVALFFFVLFFCWSCKCSFPSGPISLTSMCSSDPPTASPDRHRHNQNIKCSDYQSATRWELNVHWLITHELTEEIIFVSNQIGHKINSTLSLSFWDNQWKYVVLFQLFSHQRIF